MKLSIVASKIFSPPGHQVNSNTMKVKALHVYLFQNFISPTPLFHSHIIIGCSWPVPPLSGEHVLGSNSGFYHAPLYWGSSFALPHFNVVAPRSLHCN